MLPVIPTFAVSQYFSIALAATALVAAVGLVALYLPMLRRLGRAARGSASAAGTSGGSCVQGDGVSVIVYTHANAKGLAKVLTDLRAQDFDGKWEVVVVNDGKDSDVDDYLTIAGSNSGQWLRSTFTPPVAHGLSRKKLALTLGIKAARYPAVLLLTSESRLPGQGWLKAMSAPLCSGEADLVVGYAGPCYSDIAQRRLLGRRSRRHLLLDDLLWLDDALTGHAWRGDGDNMGLRRSLFFDHSGFGNSLNLQYGDDDVFVSDTATDGNTAVVLSGAARVSTEAPLDAPAYYRHKRERHAMMQPYCSRRPRWRRLVAAVLPWVWLIATVAALATVVADLPAALAPALAHGAAATLGGVGLTAIALWTTLGVAFNRVSTTLTGRHLRWAVVGMLLTHPFSRRPRRALRSWQPPLS